MNQNDDPNYYYNKYNEQTDTVLYLTKMCKEMIECMHEGDIDSICSRLNSLQQYFGDLD